MAPGAYVLPSILNKELALLNFENLPVFMTILYNASSNDGALHSATTIYSAK